MANKEDNKKEIIPKVEKTKTERKAQKVLYVSPEHHLEAKKAALLKGYGTMREYIEHLIEQDNIV